MNEELRKIIDRQIDMQSLWAINTGISEAMIQYALRHLHAVLEGDQTMAEFYKEKYWNLESEL